MTGLATPRFTTPALQHVFEKPAFLQGHSAARFPLPESIHHASLLMPLTSLLIGRFSSVRFCESLIILHISTSSQPQSHRLVCNERQWHQWVILVRELH